MFLGTSGAQNNLSGNNRQQCCGNCCNNTYHFHENYRDVLERIANALELIASKKSEDSSDVLEAYCQKHDNLYDFIEGCSYCMSEK